MPKYLRSDVDGATYFFTVVTQDRRPLFKDPAAVKLLGQVMRTIRSEDPFETLALVILPDHLHALWVLPGGDHDFPRRWKRIKRTFTRQWLRQGGLETAISRSRHRRGDRGVWQRRYWERLVRGEEELAAYCDYIHYNPVKHGYVGSPVEWTWSTFGRFVASGDYDHDWGRSEIVSSQRWADLEFGE